MSIGTEIFFSIVVVFLLMWHFKDEYRIKVLERTVSRIKRKIRQGK